MAADDARTLNTVLSCTAASVLVSQKGATKQQVVCCNDAGTAQLREQQRLELTKLGSSQGSSQGVAMLAIHRPQASTSLRSCPAW